jgi:hypothetical protein
MMKENYEDITDKKRWELVQIAIDAFVDQYPEACKQFFEEIKSNKTEFGQLDDESLKKANYRWTLSFPVVRNADGDDDSLLPIIERYIPGFTDKDSKYYKEFVKRYPNFSPARKL